MQKFKDINGKEWLIDITVSSARRVKTALGVNLTSLDAIEQVSRDIFTLVDTLYVLCKPQADAANITDEQFGEALGGDTVQGAETALYEAIVDFFPDPAGRATARKMLAKAREARSALLAEAGKELDEANVAELVTRLKATSGNGRASSVSTPDPSPTGSSP